MTEAFYTNFVEYKEVFKEEVQRVVELMVVLDSVLTDYSLSSQLGVDEKTLFDMALELRYGAEKAYKAKNGIKEEEFKYSDLLENEEYPWVEANHKAIKEIVENALKEFKKELDK